MKMPSLSGILLEVFHGAIAAPPEVAKLREHDPWYGMQPATFALVFGIVSGSSLPLAAGLGIFCSPDDEDRSPAGKQKNEFFDKICALMMAFGAGALLFAVATELYGHALHQLDIGALGLDEMFTIIFGAMCGGAFYLTVNQALDQYLCDEHEDDEEKGETASIAADMRKQQQAKEEEKRDQPSPKRTGKQLWQSAKRKTKEHMDKGSIAAVVDLAKSRGIELRGRDKALMTLQFRDLPSDNKDVQHAKSVALSLFLGLLVDGVPEGVLMGFLSAEGHLTPALIISLFVANFPEAFSSASLLKKAHISNAKILGMWTGLCILVGSLAGLACFLLLLRFPNFGKAGHGNHLPVHVLLMIALVEGITGGSMIACIASVMLPEAFVRAGTTGPFYSQSGFLCLTGFLMSASMKATFG